jgi:hypothetical protein
MPPVSTGIVAAARRFELGERYLASAMIVAKCGADSASEIAAVAAAAAAAAAAVAAM